MKQRLGIAQALLTRPKLLICDEPTSALDPVGRKEILDILRKISSTTTVLFSTHILSDVERICDHAALLGHGKIVVGGTLSEIKALHGHESLLLEFPMWNTLGSSPYRVKNGIAYAVNGKKIEGRELLPAYSICSQCFKEGTDVTENTVYNIVAFFNENFCPQITPQQFWSENLEENSNIRFRGTSRYDAWFIGTYYCYYPSGDDTGNSGAVLKIFKKDNVLKACLVTSIHSDEDFQSDALKVLFKKETLTKKDFDRFHNARPEGSRRFYYFEGNVEITSSSLLIVFQNCEEEDIRKLIFTLNKKRFPDSRTEPYNGGLAFAMTTSDNPFETRFYPMGVISDRYKQCSLQDDRIIKLLKLRTTGKDVRLTVKADDAWYHLALELKK